MQFDRSFYIPTGSKPITDDVTGAVAYVHASHGKVLVATFRPKAKKRSAYYSYPTAERAAEYIQRFFAGVRASKSATKEYRAKRNAERKLEVGQILYSSWGYDQTNVCWYKVTKLVGKTMVEIVKLSANSTETGNMSGKTMPGDREIGEPMRRRVAYGDTVKITESESAYVWDGKPKFWSSYH